MKRREFIRAMGIGSAVSVVPMTAIGYMLSEPKKTLTFEMVSEMQRMFMKAEVPRPKVLLVTPKAHQRIRDLMPPEQAMQYTGAKIIPMNRVSV